MEDLEKISNVEQSLASAAFRSAMFAWTFCRHSYPVHNWKYVLDFLLRNKADMSKGLVDSHYNDQDQNALLDYFRQHQPSHQSIVIAISHALYFNLQDKALYILDRVNFSPLKRDYLEWFLQTCCSCRRHEYDENVFDWRFAKRMFDDGVVTDAMLREAFRQVARLENSEACFYFWERECNVKIPGDWWDTLLLRHPFSTSSLACALFRGASIQNWMCHYNNFTHSVRYPQKSALLISLLDHGVNIIVLTQHVGGCRKLARHILHRKQLTKNKLRWTLPRVLIELVCIYMTV